MEKITNFIENHIAPPLMKFAQLKYVRIIQRTFISMTGLLIIGSLFLLFAQLPIPAYQDFIGKFASVFTSASGVATGIISVLAVVASAIATIEYYNAIDEFKLDYFGPVLIAVASFFLINPAITVETVIAGGTGSFKGFAAGAFGATGIFTGLIVSIASVEIFRYLLKRNMTLKMPAGVPPMVTQAFAALIPGFVVVTFWWIIRFVFNFDLSATIMGLFEPLISVGDTSVSVFLATFMNRLLWSVGIHGGTVVNAVGRPIWEAMNAANLEASVLGTAIPYRFSGIFMDNYIWIGLAPLALLLITSKSKRLKALGLLALPAALFNIGEPLMFGLPLVLNPLFMIPFILSYLVIAVFAVVGVTTGILPVPVLNIPWITPAPIRTLLATNGNFIAMVYVLLMWLFLALVFYPFVKILERQDLEKEAEAEALEEIGEVA